jgi:trimeric autotransporter adhesin
MNSTTGHQNTATGPFALFSNTSGSFNTANGNSALSSNVSGNSNTALGAGAGANVQTASNVICIGANVAGADVSNSCYIGQIYSNIQPQVGTDPDLVTVSSSGRLGRANVSSRRYKHDIQPMAKASEALYALRPVSFRYNKQYDMTQAPAFGLIAEDVAEVNPDLVGRNREGQPESVRYEQINAMLLNEFLKEHRKVQELEATVLRQQKGIAALMDHMKEQDSKIQRVTDQLEMSKATQQVARLE